MDYHLILASNSPRRQELLKGLDWPFEVRVKAGIDETYPDDLPAEEVPLYLSKLKAKAYCAELQPEEPHARYESEHRVLEHAALTIVNTSLEGQQLQDYYGADSARMRVIAPGVDTGIFHPLPGVHAEHEGSDTHARVVFAGRPQPLKGPHILVEALALLPADLHVELDIIGKSSSRYELDLLARTRDLGIADRVHLRSPVPADILADIFRRADIVASPSSSESSSPPSP